MGFFSKVWKGIKKGVKKVFKGIKKVVSKAWKEVKRFAKSDLGKIVIAAAAIYFGGQALGYWGTGSTNAATSTALTSSTVPEAAAASMQASAGAGANTVMAAGELGANAVLAPGQTAMGAVNAVAPSATSAAGVDAALAAGKTGLSTGQVLSSNAGLLDKVGAVADNAWTGAKDFGSKALSWMSENPALTLAGGQALSTALAPDPYEEWVKQQEYQRNNANRYGIYGDGSGRTVGLGLISRARAQAGDQLQSSTVPGSA